MKALITWGRFFSHCLAKASYKQKIARLFNIKITEVVKLYDEINNSQFMRNIQSQAGIKKGFFDFSMTMVLRAPTLYVLCRIIRPEIVVETGVADGFSSAFILRALEVNQKGHLYSIDLPNQPGQELRGSRATGWLVPDLSRGRWTLILGSSKDKLPELLSQVKKVDIFYHDSGHSYENMMFEFKTALGYLGKASLIVSDDITDNEAFADFCASISCGCLRLFKLGIIRGNF